MNIVSVRGQGLLQQFPEYVAFEVSPQLVFGHIVRLAIYLASKGVHIPQHLQLLCQDEKKQLHWKKQWCYS